MEIRRNMCPLATKISYMRLWGKAMWSLEGARRVQKKINLKKKFAGLNFVNKSHDVSVPSGEPLFQLVTVPRHLRLATTTLL